MTTLKSLYLDGANGLNKKLADAFELGRRFILPQYQDITLEDAVDISTTSPMFTIANSGSNASILAGYKVKYVDTGTEVELTVASPVDVGSTFDTTEAPTTALTSKSLKYSSPRPSSYTTLLQGLQAAAAAGKSVFSLSIETMDNPNYLRLKGNYLNAYFAGIYYALDQEGIFNTYEVSLSLDTSDTTTTKVTFNFTFTYS
jgi:hypothetical protein